jgi:PadR family transcriptional regulator, regulatory protein PadR
MSVSSTRATADRGGAGAFSGPLRSVLRTCLLMLVAEGSSYGYELHQKLADFWASPCDHGTVYRLLNLMEEDGLVLSSWVRSAKGPSRRAYTITDSGRARLREWAHELWVMRNLLVGVLDRYELGLEVQVAALLESTAVSPNGTSSGRGRPQPARPSRSSTA